MNGKIPRSNLKYNYTWKRDNGDGEYTGVQDRIRIDKDEGYEVIYFIEQFFKKLNLLITFSLHLLMFIALKTSYICLY